MSISTLELELQDPVLNKTIRVGRVIGDVGDAESGPTLVVFAGIHGNEPAGVCALSRLFCELAEQSTLPNGRLLGLCGNMKALKEKQRFLNQDLNRVWTPDSVRRVFEGRLCNEASNPEVEEQLELLEIIREVISENRNDVYFLDIHTTSAQSIPFINMNDTLENHSFAEHFPVHAILGIEEFLEGPLLSFMNELGYPSLGFEAGQHDDRVSVELSYHFVGCALQALEMFQKEDLQHGHSHFDALANAMDETPKVFEIRERHEVNAGSDFSMLPDFTSFQPIFIGQELAMEYGCKLNAKENGRIFMPLYQSQGADGYFVIRRLSRFWLSLSIKLRKWNTERLLTALPGVNRLAQEPQTLVVDKRWTRPLSLRIFHLLGYRRKQTKGNQSFFIKRSINRAEFSAWG